MMVPPADSRQVESMGGGGIVGNGGRAGYVRANFQLPLGFVNLTINC